MGRWGHSATMIADSKMLVLGGQADDDAHQATLGDLYKFDFGAWTFAYCLRGTVINRSKYCY